MLYGLIDVFAGDGSTGVAKPFDALALFDDDGLGAVLVLPPLVNRLGVYRCWSASSPIR